MLVLDYRLQASAWTSPDSDRDQEVSLSSIVKKRRKKMNKHKHRKMLRRERWKRRHG
jgi:hypothetical protein